MKCFLYSSFILINFFSYSQSTQQLEQELEIAKSQNDIDIEVKATINLAKLYEKQKNYEQAIIHYKAGLNIFEKNDQIKNVAVCFASIGSVYLKSSKYTESIEWNNKAIKLFDKLNDKNNLAFTFMLNGDNYLKLKQNEKAISYYEKSTIIYKSINDVKNEVIVLNKIGTTYSSYGNYDKALLNFKKAFSIASSVESMSNELKQINANIEATKKNTKSLEAVKSDFIKEKEAKINQTIIGLTAQRIKSLEEIEKLSIESQVKELKIKAQQEQLLLKQLQVEKQKKEYEYLQKEKEFECIQQEEKIYRQRLIIIAISILSLLLLIITVVVFKYYKAKKKALTLLKTKNIEILEQGEQIKNQAVEIARYQSQMNPHFIFNAINGFQNEILEGNKESSLNQIQSFSKLLRLTLNNSQNEYISIEDEIKYLNKYIEFELHRFSKKFKFSVQIETGLSSLEKIPTMLIQPIIENSIKHGKLNQRDGAEIYLSIKKDKQYTSQLVNITISDNGIGVLNASISKKPYHESKGTSITRQRIKLALEKIRLSVNDYYVMNSPIDSNAEFKGTQTIIKVPYLVMKDS